MHKCMEQEIETYVPIPLLADGYFFALSSLPLVFFPPAFVPEASRLFFALVASAADISSALFFHVFHPSKSINACIQPHSVTFLSNQIKFTGCIRVSFICKSRSSVGRREINLCQKIVTTGCISFVAITLK